MKAAMQEAQKPERNLHALVEPLAISGEESWDELDWAVEQQRIQVNKFIRDASLAIHTGDTTDFPFWRYHDTLSHFVWDTVRVAH